MITVKNWDSFQHYKNRRPPWIKLYRDLLGNMEWHELSDSAARLLVEIWILACEGKEPGKVNLDSKSLAWRLHRASKVDFIEKSLQELASKGFIDIASNVLASCLQHATPEKRREREEREVEKSPCGDYAQKVKDWWNAKIAPMGYHKVISMTKARTAKAKARRVLDHSEEIERALRHASDFLRGGKWFSLDWIIKNEENMLKLFEGKYEAEGNELDAHVMTDAQIRLAMDLEEQAAAEEEQGEIF